jgi:hypothetical protein
MRPTDLSAALVALIPTGRPLFVHGPPGVGKSCIIKQAAAALGKQVCDIRAVLLDPVDLRGLPVPNGECVHWKAPSFLPRSGEGVLFLDELPQAPPLVQAGCLQLTLDRAIGEYKLPDGWTVIAAGNRQEDRAGAHKLITPLLNRFIHLDLEVSNEDWDAWALESGVSPEVRSFIRFRPNLLHSFDPSRGERAFPTPRSWQFVSEVARHAPVLLLHGVIAGCVGDGPAAEYVSFHRMYHQLPDVDALLANPLAGKVPNDPAVLYALTGAITERARKADAKMLENVGTLAGRLEDEFCVLLMRDVQQVNSSFKGTRMAAQLLRKHRDVFLANIK